MATEKRTVYDYSKLKGRIKEIYNTQECFASAMRLSNAGLSQRLNNTTKFTQDEIYKACMLLSIDVQEIAIYFFTPIVQKT